MRYKKEKEDMRRKEKNVFERLAGRITAAFKNLWNGENRGSAKKEQQANKDDVAKFDAVLNGIHARQDEYVASMRTNGNLERARNLNSGRSSNQKGRFKDRADE